MEELSFGEQVKIILSRKNMTIKELAEKIQECTGESDVPSEFDTAFRKR